MVKICGITRAEDARAAAAAGADAVGFVFAPSSRQIAVDAARAIDRTDTGACRRVGVFVDAPLERVRQAIADADLDVVQLHGDESAEDCARVRCLGVDVWKRLHVRSDDDAESLTARGAAFRAEAILLDPGRGDGRAFRWSQAAGFAGRFVVAGGLSPDNVAQAIHEARPWGVDVSSGVESAPGTKDAGKIVTFVTRARAAGTGGTPERREG